MNLATSHIGAVAVVSVGEPRLTFPLLSDFAAEVAGLIGRSERQIVVDISPVGYVDSAAIGCLMDLYRQASAAGGTLKLAGVQPRVKTMLTLTGAQNFLEIYADRASALTSFGA
jgi:anti-anti-sigma factor